MMKVNLAALSPSVPEIVVVAFAHNKQR